MRRLNRWLLAVVLIASGGCGTNDRSSANPPQTSAVTVRDDLGRSVTFNRPPQRIVSIAPAHTETLYAIGAGEHVVAGDTYSDYPPEAKAKAKLNCWPRPPLEAIIALQPDLVVILTQDEEFVKQMDAAKIPVLKLFPKTVDRAMEEIIMLGGVTGNSEVAIKLVADFHGRSEAIRKSLEGVKPVRFLYELDAMEPGRPFVAGPEGFYGEMMKMAGGANIFSDLKGPSGQVSAELIVERNPQVILLGDSASPVKPQSAGTVRARPGWQTIEAIRTGRIHPLNSDLITRPGPRLIEGLEKVAHLFHPDKFK